jgi:hypothetical protein
MITYEITSKCFPKDGKKEAKKNWLKNKNMYIAKTNLGDRYMIKVNQFNDKNVNLYMDIITGSLYNTRGRCLSSSQITASTFSKLIMDSNTLLEEITKKLKEY